MAEAAKNPPDYYYGYGELLRAHRMTMCLGAATMAERLNMTERSWTNIEQSRSACFPGLLDTVAAMVEEFEDAVDELIGRAEDSGATAAEPMQIPIEYRGGNQWARAVVGRAAVASGIIIPIADGLTPEHAPKWGTENVAQS